MTDRELVGLAAKAYFGEHFKGEVKWTLLPKGGFWEALTEGQSHDDLLGFQRFDPLNYDDDALRLAVKLGIEIHPDRQVSEIVTTFCVHRPHLVGLNTYEEFGDDEMAAARRAIVRAAAEIGRELVG